MVISIIPANSYAKECVVLLHGMARTEKSMTKLAEKLDAAEYQVVNKGYPSTQKTVEALAVPVIDEAIGHCSPESKAHIVTHSLGGILVRYYMKYREQTEYSQRVDRVVMLAPPNKGSQIVDKLGHLSAYQWINGPVGLQLGIDKQSMPNQLGDVDFELGVIAGSRSINLILSTMLPNPDDGKVSVANTKVEGMKDHIVMPVSHPFIMKNDEVIKQVLLFLRTGKFNHS